MPSLYYQQDLSEKVQAGEHRNLIGGLWEEVGQLQLSFLQSQGMQAHQRLLDIGCGSLRLGCLAVDALEPGHYYGIDISDELMDAGYNKELTDRQRERLPRSHLFATDSFDLSFLRDSKMDVAIAQSVFTHLPLNHMRDCLMKLHPYMKPGSAFYMSFFLCPDHHDISKSIVHPATEQGGAGIRTFATQDPYHYKLSDIEYCCVDTPWKFQFIGDWEHPRNQQMAVFINES